MIIYYHHKYNFNLGLLSHLHLFDGHKFQKVHDLISGLQGIEIEPVDNPISQ